MSFFDTDFVIDLLREQRRNIVGPAHRKLMQSGETPVRLSIFVVCELEAGGASFHDPEEIHRVRRLCQQFEVVYPDERFAPLYGQILASLKRQGLSVATMDLLIGIQTLVENEVLVTRNVRHFEKIPSLRIDRYEGSPCRSGRGRK
jgi:tRNA(fMet)-specific endonuclease VapC